MGDHSCTFRSENLNHDVTAHNRLRTAVRCRDESLVQHLVNNGVKVPGVFKGVHRDLDAEEDLYALGPTNYAQLSPLHLAVISRNAKIVKTLLDKGADMNAKVWNGETPLTLAAKMQNATIIDLLLIHESIQDSFDYDWLTHLHIACMRNNVEVVKKLLLMNQGERLNKSVAKTSVFWAGYTPLHFAVHFECVETVKFLLDCGAKVTILDGRQCSPLHLANLQRNEAIIDLLLEAHKNEFGNPTNAAGLSHFHIACTRDDTSVIEHFLKMGVDIDKEVTYSQWEGWRSIHFAMLYECSNTIELLLKNRVCLESYCFPELLKCSYVTENKSNYDLFLGNHMESNEKEVENRELSVLWDACILDDAETIETLINDDLINLRDLQRPFWNGWIPLHLAIKCRSESVVKILLKQGADILAQDAKGRTALHLTFKNDSDNMHSEIMKYFSASKPNITDNEGLSTLHILCAGGHVKAVKIFLENGVNCNSQVGSRSACWAGFTPMHFAVNFRKKQVIDTLLMHGADVLLTNALNLNAFDFTIDAPLCVNDTFEILLKIFLHASGNHIPLNSRGFTILHGLCASSHTILDHFQQYLITHREEVDKIIDKSRVFLKYTPLHVAMIDHHRTDYANLLLKNGADPTILNDDGDTYLESQFSHGVYRWRDSYNEVDGLFTLSARNDNCKFSHFHLACGSGCLGAVESILHRVSADTELKINILNHRNDYGQTPLHSLLLLRNDAQPREKIAELLLKNGANVNAKDFELQTPLHHAQLKKEPSITRILITHGADVNAQNMFGQTPLHKLLSDIQVNYTEYHLTPVGFFDQLKLLLDEGSDVNIADKRGQTCLTITPRIRGLERKKGIANILLAHLKKLQMIGYYINKDNERCFLNILRSPDASTFNEANFVEECVKELAIMKNEYIDRYTTLYSILFKSLNSMTLHCGNATLQSMISSDEFLEKFPLYGFFIKLQVRNGRIRRPLLNESKNSLRSILARQLPPQCIESILTYLSNADLRNIIASI